MAVRLGHARSAPNHMLWWRPYSVLGSGGMLGVKFGKSGSDLRAEMPNDGFAKTDSGGQSRPKADRQSRPKADRHGELSPKMRAKNVSETGNKTQVGTDRMRDDAKP